MTSVKRDEGEQCDMCVIDGSATEMWNVSHWNGDAGELRASLAKMSLSPDVYRHICIILDDAEPTRYATLLACLINSASQLSRAERDFLLQLDPTEDCNTEANQLLKHIQLSQKALAQWQALAAQDQQLILQPETQRRSASASAHSGQGSQLSIIPLTRALSDPTVCQKRAHSTTPAEGEQIRQIMRTKLQQEPSGEVTAMLDIGPPSLHAELLATRDTWPELWEKQGVSWPTSARAEFPLERSSTEVWMKAVQREPTKLIHMVQLFPFPEELLGSLGDTVLQAWTAAWRRTCLQGRLTAYRGRTTDKSTRKWLDDWIVKLSRPAPHNLPSLVDNNDDWRRLRNCGYGNDMVLKLCDVGNKSRLAQHIICAIVYDKEIQVLTGLEDSEEQGVLSRLLRHLDALKTENTYREAYAVTKNTVDWFAVARFFSSAFEHGGAQRPHQY